MREILLTVAWGVVVFVALCLICGVVGFVLTRIGMDITNKIRKWK